MKIFLELFSTVVVLFILITAGLFDPEHAAPGLYLFGHSEQLETLGKVSASIVPVIATVYTILMLVILVAIAIIVNNPNASAQQPASPYSYITNLQIKFSIILFAFIFATGFWYTGIVGLLMTLSGLLLVRVNTAAQQLLKNQSSE